MTGWISIPEACNRLIKAGYRVEERPDSIFIHKTETTRSSVLRAKNKAISSHSVKRVIGRLTPDA